MDGYGDLVTAAAEAGEADAPVSSGNFLTRYAAALQARSASEAKAGGSLTIADKGVVSEFLVPTDYSPLR